MTRNERPYVVFERTYNKGLPATPDRYDSAGKLKRAAFKGEHTIEQVKHLVDSRPPFSPYVWATKDWVLYQAQKGCKIIGYGNFDKLPADYPKEWRQQIEACLPIVKPLAEAHETIQKMKEQLNANEQTETELPRPQESLRSVNSTRKRAPRETRETSQHEAS